METTLIGAGRYGNSLLGLKYENGSYYDMNMKYVVDPRIKQISKQKDFKYKKANLCDSLEQISRKNINKNSIAEFAVIPQKIPPLFIKAINKGYKKIIFPKPVTYDYDSFMQMNKIAEENNIQTAITSNWHYSDITKFTKAIINKLTNKPQEKISSKFGKYIKKLDGNFKIKKAEIEYSKKDEVLTIPPPSQELPHALQIVQSTNLANLDNCDIEMYANEQSSSRVNVKLKNKNIEDCIEINSDLKKGDKLNCDKKRVLKIYLNDDDPGADIVADYNVVFKDGKCIKPGSVYVDIKKDGKRTTFKKEIKEDNMDKMYSEISASFHNQKNNVLTMQKYNPVAKKTAQIQKKWNSLIR